MGCDGREAAAVQPNILDTAPKCAAQRTADRIIVEVQIGPARECEVRALRQDVVVLETLRFRRELDREPARVQVAAAVGRAGGQLAQPHLFFKAFGVVGQQQGRVGQRAAERHQVGDDPAPARLGRRILFRDPDAGWRLPVQGLPRLALGAAKSVGVRVGRGAREARLAVAALEAFDLREVQRVDGDLAVHLMPVVPEDVVGDHRAQAVADQHHAAVAVHHLRVGFVAVVVQLAQHGDAAAQDVVAPGDVLRVDIEVACCVAGEVGEHAQQRRTGQAPQGHHKRTGQAQLHRHAHAGVHGDADHDRDHRQCNDPGQGHKPLQARVVLRPRASDRRKAVNHERPEPGCDVRHRGAIHLVGPVVLVEVGLGPIGVAAFRRIVGDTFAQLQAAQLVGIRQRVGFAVIGARGQKCSNERPQRVHRALLADAVDQHDRLPGWIACVGLGHGACPSVRRRWHSGAPGPAPALPGHQVG